jgi:hypothetical protein
LHIIGGERDCKNDMNDPDPDQAPRSTPPDETAKRLFARAARTRVDARQAQDRARNLRQAGWLRRELKNRRPGGQP